MSKRLAYTIGSLADLGNRIGAVQAPSVDGSDITIAPPSPGKLNGDGYPAGVTPTKKAWLEDGRYRLQSGDTLSGMARTYLDDPGRWKEIWNVQETAIKTGKSPDKLNAGMVLNMPPEAQKKARALGVLGMDPATKKALMAVGATVGVLTLAGLAWKLSAGGRRTGRR